MQPLRSAEERGLRGSLGYVLKFWAFLAVFKEKKVYPKKLSQCMFRDRGAILRWEGGGGAPLVTQYWGRGSTKQFFLLIFIILEILGGGARAPLPPPTLRSLMFRITEPAGDGDGELGGYK